MKRQAVLIFLMVILFVTTFSEADLYDRGGGLIYDDVLDITWLQNANYAQTSSYDLDGRMTWTEALAWAGQLDLYGSAQNPWMNNREFCVFLKDSGQRANHDLVVGFLYGTL